MDCQSEESLADYRRYWSPPLDNNEPLKNIILATEYEELKEHSKMLGQIAAIVEDYCQEHHTTLDGVKFLEAELNKYKVKYLEGK